MKKLMIAAAAVGLAVMAQAASIQWQVSAQSFTLQDGSKPDAVPVYLVYTGATAYNDMIASIAAGDAFNAADWSSVVMGSATSYDSSPFAANPTAQQMMLNNNYGLVALNSVPATGLTAGSNYDFAFLVFDSNASGDYYAVSATTGGMPYAGDDPSVGSPAAFSATAFTDTANGATGWVKIETVPEPTSGLLLLLGVAGLALKRRRA